MPYKSKQKDREWHREYMRKKRNFEAFAPRYERVRHRGFDTRTSDSPNEGYGPQAIPLDADGNPIWEEGVLYNESGVLAVPIPLSVEEWEQKYT